MSLAKYYEVAKIHILEKISYSWNQVFYGLIIGIVLFVFVHIWQAIYAGKLTIEGFSIAQMIWYLALAEVIVFSAGGQGIERIGEDVKSGIIASSLTKPINFVGKEFAVLLANFIYTFLISGFIAFAVAYFLVGPIPFHFANLPMLLVMIAGAAVLNFTLVIFFGLFAFWFEDVSSIYFIYQKLIFIMGGMLVPIDVYPIWVQGIVKYLPFSFITYMPAKLFVHFEWSAFLTGMIGQLAWILVGAMLLKVIYDKGIKRVNINGG
ncbi:MAG: ABC-2 family transporter protein [Nanoarchaeota archaeon]